jgi:hypothetical protein
MALYCPPEAPFSFLIPDHRYIFKESVRRHPHQFWMEVAAYRIGTVMVVPVPPAFVAYDNVGSKEGALIEWFYAYPGTSELYIDGGNFMKRLIPRYDIEKGTQHNFRTITALMRGLRDLGLPSETWIEHWAKVFTFDSIIGNTDRHHDNWGLVSEVRDGKVVQVSLSPAFDNGTSLGYEILDENIANFTDERLKQYIRRGTHHVKWTAEAERSQHFDLVIKYIEKYPDSKKVVLNCLHFDYNGLAELIWELTEFETLVPLLPIRAEFMLRLIKCRREMFLEVLGE